MGHMTDENIAEVAQSVADLLSGMVKGVVLPLNLLNTGALFSETVRELREVMQDSLLERQKRGFLSSKKAAEAKTPPVFGLPTEKETIVQNIKYLARSVAEQLENHHWNKHFLAELGDIQPEGKPFVEQADDSFQVLQIKKVVNALYHLELGLKAIESEDLKGLLSYLSDFVSSEETKKIAEDANSRTWSGYVYDWYKSVAVTPSIGLRVRDIIYHIHAACDLITHIEPEFLGAFGPEFAWIKEHLDSKRLADGINTLKEVVGNQKGSDVLSKVAYLQGLLLDQLRPHKTGGADFSLLLQLATVFGKSVDEKTKDMQDTFSDSGKVFLKLKSLVLGHGVHSEMFDKVEALVTEEIKRRPKEEKKRLEELNQTAAKLTKAFDRLSGSSLLLPLDIVHYASIAWYASSLLSDLSKRTTALSVSSQQAIREVVIVIRDKLLAELVGFADKAEEAALSAAGSFTAPLIAQLEKQYNPLVEDNGFAGLNTIGPLQSDAFTKKRFEMAKSRRFRYMKELAHVEEVLIPALASLTKANPSTPEREQMASMFQALQPHIEEVDANFSNQMLKRLGNAINQSSYPVISTYPYPIGYKATVDAISARLNRVIRTKKLAIQLSEDLIEQSIFEKVPALRELLKPLSEQEKLCCKSDGLPACTLADLKPASERQVNKYLVWDNAEGSTEDGTPDAVIKKAEKFLDTAWGEITSVVDSDGNHDSSLSLLHVSNTLKDLKAASGTIQKLSSNNFKVTYVTNTLGLFNSFIDAFVSIKPFGMALYSAYQTGSTTLKKTYEAQTKHYRFPEGNKLSDWAYSGMHAALTGSAHFKALAKGQPELPETGKKNADEQARVFSDEVGTLASHANMSWWFVRYPVLAYDTGRILFKRMIGQETIDKQAIHAVNKLSHAAYKTMIEHGLEGLNTHAFHELLCTADDMERALGVPPGSLSIPLEDKIDAYMKAFLAPLSVPSEKYFEVRVNETSYHARAARVPYGSSHATFFDKRLNQDGLIEKRKDVVREEAIDRALDLELMRIQKSEKFHLKYADKLYLRALREALRPAVKKLTLGEGGFEARAFDVMYKQAIEDLAVFDRGGGKGSCRLDAMRESISKLEAYLKPTYEAPHGFFFYLFEDKNTHAKKLGWVKQLRTFADDKTRLPSARIQAIQDLLSSTVLQKDMQTYSALFSLPGLLRCITWLLSCVWLCSSKTVDIIAVDGLVRAADVTVSELQVFDELYAKDYRRLDAMLEQVKALEHYLESTLDKAEVGRRKLFEDVLTRIKKREWVKKLRDIAEDMEKTPAARIDAMCEVMREPQFKREMLQYGAIDNCFTFKAFKRGVLWLLSCIGLYTLPCTAEHKALVHAAKPYTTYSASPLIDVGLFSKSAPSTDRNYTAESASGRLGFSPTA